MAKTTLEDCMQRLLAKLEKAGEKGLSKSRLGIGSANCKAAFEGLIKTQQIGDLGRRGRSNYVLRAFYNPEQRAMDKILSLAVEGQPRLFSKTRFSKALPAGVIRHSCDAAITTLVDQRGLVEIKHGGIRYYLHWSALPTPPQSVQSSVKMVEAPTSKAVDGAQLQAAYRGLVERDGFPDVALEELRQGCGRPAPAAFSKAILSLCKEKKATLSRGDTSLASPEARKNALEVGGVRYLMVRFLGSARG